MKVNGCEYRTIWLAEDGWTVEIIDQTKLPHVFESCRLETVEAAAAAIRDMQEGNEPPYILRDPDENHFQHLLAINEVVPSSVDWKNLWKERMTS